NARVRAKKTAPQPMAMASRLKRLLPRMKKVRAGPKRKPPRKWACRARNTARPNSSSRPPNATPRNSAKLPRKWTGRERSTLPTEAVAIAKALEERAKPAAAERKKASQAKKGEQAHKRQGEAKKAAPTSGSDRNGQNRHPKDHAAQGEVDSP